MNADRNRASRPESSAAAARPAALVVCATPIGNLDDASPRLARELAAADLVACEDTRRTRILLDRLGVRARAVAYHQVGERQRAAALAGRIAAGERVALVTDAGTPAVSDPGWHLVQACLARGLPVEVVPGPSAVLAALVLSGLPTDRFCFEGFLPRKGAAREARLEALGTEPRTTVLFEAPVRALGTLADLGTALGLERRCAVARELTKVHEQVLRGTLAEVRDRVAAEPLRGEVTIVLAGAARERLPVTDLPGEVATLVAAGASIRDAIAEVARASGLPRREVYGAVVAARPPT